MGAGDLAFVLHAHLPFIRHPEHRYHLEENWLYEATTATYLPLLDAFRGLTRYAAYLDRMLRLADSELRRTEGDPTFHKLARFYADRFGRLKALYDELRGDVVGAFRQLQDDG